MNYYTIIQTQSPVFRNMLTQFLENGGKVHVQETKREIKATFDTKEDWDSFFAIFKPKKVLKWKSSLTHLWLS